MRTTGRYEATTDDYDVDHEINKQTDLLEERLDELKSWHTPEDFKVIAVAMAQTILNKL